jgi:hypothetical protein
MAKTFVPQHVQVAPVSHLPRARRRIKGGFRAMPSNVRQYSGASKAPPSTFNEQTLQHPPSRFALPPSPRRTVVAHLHPNAYTHTLALLNKLNICRQSALWKWRLPRHAQRVHIQDIQDALVNESQRHHRWDRVIGRPQCARNFAGRCC